MKRLKGALGESLPFATQRCHVLFHSLFKVLFIFRSHYLFAIGLETIFSLRRSTPASLHSTLKLCDLWNKGELWPRTGGYVRDDSPLWWNFSERLIRRAKTSPKSKHYNSTISDSFHRGFRSRPCQPRSLAVTTGMTVVAFSSA